MRSFKWMLGFTVACVAIAPAALYAEDAQIPAAYLATGSDSPVAVYTAAVRVTGDTTPGALGESVDNTALAGMSGGTMVIQDTTITGSVTSDTADHVISGDNLISGGSFAGAAGVPVVIQNSGSNVLIQNATVLNVQFKP
ncbi:hypothetical protein [Dyella silvae]|uniref:hypothetical protein n=1 Tax=Dyella silvae TaxID=2994424 RepID=UPI002264991B|nr:hypothetical protein [Dyella silvae]